MTVNEKGETVAAGDQCVDRLEGEDKRLVDLVTAALVDPNLHTAARMRLHREITEILRPAHEHEVPPRPSVREVERHEIELHDDRLGPVLTAVLVDPNLHTDTRMRLRREISKILPTPGR